MTTKVLLLPFLFCLLQSAYVSAQTNEAYIQNDDVVNPALGMKSRIYTYGYNDRDHSIEENLKNIGGGLFIGLEQITPAKKDHPMFLEVAYNYRHSYKVSILDASRSADVIILSEGESNDFSAHYIVIRLGASLF